MHYIYKITNLINQKIYIGQSKKPVVRWSQHKNEARKQNPSMIINQAMKKYGVENFTFEIIEECETDIEANLQEEWNITTYCSHVSTGLGYNVSLGGSVAPKSEEWKQQQKNRHAANRKARFTSEVVALMIKLYTIDELNTAEIAKELNIRCDRNLIARMLKENGITMIKQKSRSKELNRQANLGKKPTNLEWLINNVKTNNPNKGKKMSDEQKQKLSISHKGMHSSPETQFKPGMISWNKGKKSEPKKCSIEECENHQHAKSYCMKHYKQIRKYEKTIIKNV